MRGDKEYYLCSSKVIEIMKPEEFSKPIKWFNSDTYIAVLDYEETEKKYNEFNQNDGSLHDYLDFWCREIVPGTMETQDITLWHLKRKNIFNLIEDKLGLTSEKNVAMCISNFSKQEGLNPIELFNKCK